MVKHLLKVTWAGQPQPDALVFAHKLSICAKLVCKLLGDTQELVILVLGNQIRSVEIVRSDDDLMALARAVDVTTNGGDRK